MFGLGPMELLILLPLLGIFMFPLWTLIDVLKGEFAGNNKIIWVLVIIFLPFIGSITYVTVGRGQKRLA